MIDAVGRPQRLLLLGGTSDIAVAIAAEYSRSGTPRIELAARPSPKRTATAARLQGMGLDVTVSDFDATAYEQHPELIRSIADRGDIDVAVLAFGLLGEEEHAWQDHQDAMAHVETNFAGAVSVGVCLAQVMRAQGHGSIVALSSVAGERIRRSNFVYGATKAGMDGFYLGLGEALREDGVHVLVVRPGFVRTTMTEGRSPAPMAVGADTVARAVVEGVARRRELVWSPGKLRFVMSGLRHIPRPLFRRLPI